MPRWTAQQYADYQTRDKQTGAKPQHVVKHEPVAAQAREARYAKRILVSVVSFRIRLCDVDNLCPKYFIDCLRYAEIIPDDNPEAIDLQVKQVKVAHKSEERTEIEVTL